MFKLKPNPTFFAPVEISVPGEAEPAKFEVEFKHKSASDLHAYFSNLSGRTDADALAEVIAGWRGVDVPYSAEALADLLNNYPVSAMELFTAYRRELLESRRKN